MVLLGIFWQSAVMIGNGAIVLSLRLVFKVMWQDSEKKEHLEGGAKGHKEQFIGKLLPGSELRLNQGTFPISE